MSLRTRMIAFQYSAATGSKKARILLTPVVALFFFTVIILMVLLFLRIDRWLHLPSFPVGPWNLVLSVPLLALGLVFVGWSNARFFMAKGTPVPLNPPPKVVTTGPYAYVRNPMLTGVFLVLFGLGILARSIAVTFLFTPLFILLNVLEIRGVEEPELAKRLGEEYIEYRKRTPMFFPRWKQRGSIN
jgi:protein-S-isoprenylcysteine O-methyltransferase Ste14